MEHSSRSSARVRFAPSPTGYLHIGNFRTALFNFLFARHHGGIFLIRIEDSDQERSSDVFTKNIFDALTWANMQADEPVVIQSKRRNRHTEAIEQLLSEDKAYKCYCTSSLTVIEEYYKYDGACRSKERVIPNKNTPYVIRLKLPLTQQRSIIFNDLIRGEIIFDSAEFDDFIIARSDGTPVYNLAVVVDDADMKITHVIRGEDHISNTPKQILLYEALGFAPPRFAHIPLILGSSGKRLSKRDGATSVLEYKKQGYLPEALCNYLARLGWAHGDQELFSREELIKYFTLDGVGKSAAIFDQEKLDWMNGVYIRKKSAQELAQIILEVLDDTFLKALLPWQKDTVFELISLYQERVKTLLELRDEVLLLHNGPKQDSLESYNLDDVGRWTSEKTVEYLETLKNALFRSSSFDHDEMVTIFKNICNQYSVKLQNLAQPTRIALIGKASGPGIYAMLSYLNIEEITRRIDDFVSFLEKNYFQLKHL